MSLFLFFCGHKSLFTNWKNFCNITISEIPSPPHQKKSKNTTTVTGVQKKTTILYFTTPKMCDVYKPIWIFQVFSKEKVPKFTLNNLPKKAEACFHRSRRWLTATSHLPNKQQLPGNSWKQIATPDVWSALAQTETNGWPPWPPATAGPPLRSPSPSQTHWGIEAALNRDKDGKFMTQRQSFFLL